MSLKLPFTKIFFQNINRAMRVEINRNDCERIELFEKLIREICLYLKNYKKPLITHKNYVHLWNKSYTFISSVPETCLIELIKSYCSVSGLKMALNFLNWLIANNMVDTAESFVICIQVYAVLL